MKILICGFHNVEFWKIETIFGACFNFRGQVRGFGQSECYNFLEASRTHQGGLDLKGIVKILLTAACRH